LILCACSKTTTEPTRELSVRTDKGFYSLDQEITISLYNGTTSTAYFTHCNFRLGFHIERKAGDTWPERASVAVLCLAINPSGVTQVAPEGTNTDRITLAEPGIYRIKYRFGWQQTNAWTDSLLSNEFVVQ